MITKRNQDNLEGHWCNSRRQVEPKTDIDYSQADEGTLGGIFNSKE